MEDQRSVTDDLLHEGERIDDLECRGFCIIQNPSSFCFGMDAVLLANFASIKRSSAVIDLGTGTGIIPILLHAKEKGRQFTGLEIQHDMADMASRSVALNNAGDSISIVEGDIRNVRNIFKAASFDAVTSNPPYIEAGNGLHNPDNSFNIARHEILVTLEDVISAAAFLLRTGGSFHMVHKPHRIVEIMELMRRHHLEPKRMQLVQPKAGREPNMLLIEAVRDAGQFCRVLPSLIIYDNEGNYTPEVLKLYES